MLKINNLIKIFDSGGVNEKIALENVKLELEQGDFVTVIGGNGAGKSTLLNVIAGVDEYQPNNGTVFIDKEEVNKKNENQRAKYIGRVFQDPLKGTSGSMTILENLALAKRRGKKFGLSFITHKKEKDDLIKRLKILGLGLENRINVDVRLLSGGQRQALTLLMATIKKPSLLLLDEHTAALDPKTANKVLEITDKIVKKENITTLMVTHNMKDALKYGNRLIMMHEGKIILDIHEEEKKNLEVKDLLALFEESSGSHLDNDRMLLG